MFFCFLFPSRRPAFHLQGWRPPWGGAGPLLALFVICILIQLTQRGPFSTSNTFWGFILLWLFSSRNGSLCGKQAFGNQWEFCVRANSKKRARSVCRFIGIWYREGRLSWGELATSVFPKSQAVASLCDTASPCYYTCGSVEL